MVTPLPKYQLNKSSVETRTLRVVLASADPNSESSVEKGKALISAADVFVSAYEHFHVAVPLQANIEIITGYAVFTSDPKPTVEVNGEKYTAPHILIATGGVPSHPQESQIPGESPRGKCLWITARGSLSEGARVKQSQQSLLFRAEQMFVSQRNLIVISSSLLLFLEGGEKKNVYQGRLGWQLPK